MIVKKKLGKLKATGKHVDYVEIDWFERDRKILRKITTDGREVGIRIDEPLYEGDILFEDEATVIAVTILPCDLVRVRVTSMEEMGRLCFELGNRHLSLSITGDTVRCPYDAPTFTYLEHLGFHPEKVNEKFDGYIECKAHAHPHNHEHTVTHEHESSDGHSHGHCHA